MSVESNLFPIYDVFYNQVDDQLKNVPLTATEIKDLILKIKSLDKLGSDMIYVITRVHSIRNSESKLLEVPYGGQKLSERIDNNESVNDVKFDIRLFPALLNRILDKFCDMHLRKIKEDEKHRN